MKRGVFFLFSFLLGAIVSYFLVKGHFKAISDTLEPKVEQVVIRDTIVAYFPKEIEKRILVHDSVAIVRLDTLWRRDTIYLPREQKVYADSSYRAVVSGISPRLDSIEVYNKTIEITKISTRKEWRKFDYGVQGGVGVLCPFGATPTFGGYAGVGVTWHF